MSKLIKKILLYSKNQILPFLNWIKMMNPDQIRKYFIPMLVLIPCKLKITPQIILNKQILNTCKNIIIIS